MLAERCEPRNGGTCPTRGRGRYCGKHHARIVAPQLGLRVYDFAEKYPAAGLVRLDAGPTYGHPIVTPEDRVLWHELTQTAARVPQPRPSTDPGHRVELRPGFGNVIDQNRGTTTRPPVATPAAVPEPAWFGQSYADMRRRVLNAAAGRRSEALYYAAEHLAAMARNGHIAWPDAETDLRAVASQAGIWTWLANDTIARAWQRSAKP